MKFHHVGIATQDINKTIEKLKAQRAEKNEKLSRKEEEQANQFKQIEDLKSQIIKLEVKKTNGM